MKTKFKLLLDYQYVSSDKRIFLIKSGTIIEDYIFKTKGADIKIDKEIVDMNPHIFQLLDWKNELLTHLKLSKIAQPAQVIKKLIPFIEDILLASTSISITDNSDRHNDLLDLESSLNRRETKLNDDISEVELRFNLVDKREKDIKLELKEIDKKDDSLRDKLSSLKIFESDLIKKENDLNKKERDIDHKLLETDSNLEEKFKSLQDKIENDIENLNTREFDLDRRTKEIVNKENNLSTRESKIIDSERDITIKYDDIMLIKEEVDRINIEIDDWEKLHWKFKRMGKKPPSCE